MAKQSTIKEYIEDLLQVSRFAVLATEGDGQPHASLVAITPFGNSRKLIFATYRNRLKYRNLANNSKVAVLIESSYVNLKGLKESAAACQAHLKRHPEMESFMLSSDCAIMEVIAQSYQVVNGIEDVRWVTTDDLK